MCLVSTQQQYRHIIFQVVRCGSKRGHQLNMRLKHVALHAQNMLTISSSTINMIKRDIYKQPMSMRILTLVLTKTFIRPLKSKINGYGHDLDLIITSHKLYVFISYERWVRERNNHPK